MNNKALSFFKNIKDKKVTFVGIGVTNTDTIRLFARQGLAVTACDRRSRDQVGPIAGELEALGVTLRLGEHYLDDLDAHILMRTPGMYFNLPVLQEFRRNGGVVTSEMELFFDLCPCPVIAITGSDGKTTSTSLIAELLRAQGFRVHLGGNIGKALLPLIFDISPEDYAVVELSSFQLISMRCAPQTAVVTNVTPNHLDVHGVMEEYIDAKRNIFLHQNAFSRTVLGADNEITASFTGQVRGECMTFSLEKQVEHGAYLAPGGMLMQACHGKDTPLFHKDDIRLPGLHNVANYLDAICAVAGLVEPVTMHRVAREFGGVEHRMEFVRELHGVKWYNDCIATSPTRVIAGLRSFEQKIIVLAGGYDKKIPFEPMAADIVAHVKLLILMGATANKIEQAVTAYPGYQGSPEIVHAADQADAVAIAHRLAKPGDIVTLSPACASFDSYPNFEYRGRHFKDLVHALR